MPIHENASNKIEEEFKISISLKNFSYSNTISNAKESAITCFVRKIINKLLCLFSKVDNKKASRFFGRTKEKAKLLNRLQNANKDSRGSFLVAGYRGVGKTRFVDEVLGDYKKNSHGVIEVRINLGSDGELSSKSVLFNMVSLLASEIDKKIFPIITHLFLLPGSSLLGSLLPVTGFCLLLAVILTFLGIDKISCVKAIGCINPDTFIIGFLFLVLIRQIIACRSEYRKALGDLKTLEKEIYSTTDNHARIKTKFWDYGNRIVANPLTSNQIESKLKFILEDLKKAGTKVIFIFDELDKLSGGTADKKEVNFDLIKESKLRKQQVDSILGDLKNLITNSHARYIFIAGRDMYDAYLSERGNSNSLYESLFNDHIYIPSLLTDHSDGEVYLLDSMIEAFVVSNLIPKECINQILIKKCNQRNGSKEMYSIDLSQLKLSDYVQYKKSYAKNWLGKCVYTDNVTIDDKMLRVLREEVYILKTLIHFLTLHSWGNCKRLFTLFESFVRREGEDYELYFSTQDMQRLILSSQLYILFHNSLSRMLMNADDKLVVSSFSIFHYILKYHGIGFSREHILRMYETINIHSSPELTRIVDIIIHNVLMNHVRRIRNSFYQYRFTFLHEKEIHFITTINDGESAAFNFSLNAMDAVKQHYKNLIVESKQTHADERYGHATLASIHVIVGNFHFWEQSFDEASIHYGVALDMLEKNGGLTRNIENMDLLLQMVEIYLKQGAAAERVSNYSAAAASYLNAEILSNDCLKKLSGKVNERDSKWDILRQPKWAKEFLNLKQSIQDKPSDLIKNELIDVSKYRKAVLMFFKEDFASAHNEFMGVIKLLDQVSNRSNGIRTLFQKLREVEYRGYLNERDRERTYFLEGNAYLKAGFSLFLQFGSDIHMELKAKAESFNKNFKKEAEEEDDEYSKLKCELECNEKLLGDLLCSVIKPIDKAMEGIDKITSLDKFEYINDKEAKKMVGCTR